MPKNILIINSLPCDNRPLVNLFEKLKQAGGHLFYLLSIKSGLLNQFQAESWPGKKARLGPNLNIKINALIFLILLPMFFLLYLFRLIYFKRGKKITSVILLNWNEKIIFTLIAKIIKIKTIWLEFPDANFSNMPKLIIWLYKINSKWADIICFTGFTKMRLKKIGIKEHLIKIIPLGIKLNRFERQDTIFNKLARAGRKGFQRKYFTVGAIVDLSHQQKIEPLLQAIKRCLTIIPNIQLIVVGGGDEKKPLSWLAKKMEIDSIVWFVGEQSRAKNWLESFDVFVAASDKPSITDLRILLRAMSAGLPVIGPANNGLEDIILENKNGILIDTSNSEMLAQAIIKLQQNRQLRLRLGKEAKEQIDKNFSISLMAEKFEKLLL
ncbi:glycosyltransferase family 4 protein [Patescibacteria group bacterium]|nr:glycosyltransferase family 4 protein [Patescibacteria group bacterium]MBU4600438.1 glycosyltransferase family 4 protein [Patescibacteria group bacterium]MCG2698310.1 glycosyltransferase family 4 protein [Candidatus Parcubacteria bacterium]